MIKLQGTICFDPYPKTKKHQDQAKWKKTMLIQIGGDLDLFYSKFIEKAYGIHLIRPQRLAHLTIIADRCKDDFKWNTLKKKYDGMKVDLYYDVDLSANDQYWWLRCECKIGDKIRRELNLGTPYFPYHITVGSVKDLEIEHNKYIIKKIEDRYMKTLSNDDVKKIRQRTGLGCSICKRALGKARGDIEKAVYYAQRLETQARHDRGGY